MNKITFKDLSVQFTILFVLFLILNFFSYFLIQAFDSSNSIESPLKKYSKETLLKAYPNWKIEDLKDLLCCPVAYTYEPFTGFRHFTQSSRFVHLNPNGFREVKNQGPWPISQEFKNIFWIGSSTAFGTGLPDDQTIASQLQEILNSTQPKVQYRVYNFSRVGFFSTQERILFENFLLNDIKPDGVVFLDGLNDFYHMDGLPEMSQFLTEATESMSSPATSSVLKLPLFDFLKRSVRKQLSIHSKNSNSLINSESPNSVIQRIFQNHKLTRAISDSQGIKALFVLQPIPTYQYDLKFHLFANNNPNVFSKAALLARSGYESLTLASETKLSDSNTLWLQGLQKDLHENLYVDSIHYNAAFSRTIALEIAKRLNQMGFH